MIEKLKVFVRNTHILAIVNGFIKEFILLKRYSSLTNFYAKKAKSLNYIYDENAAIEEFINRSSFHYKSVKKKKLNIFWIGSNQNQDNSGFLQALKDLANVTEFYDQFGNYGQSVCKASYDKTKFEDFLIQSFIDANNSSSINLVLGQMLAKYVPKSFIDEVHKYKVPVVNISMDDRLPDLWRYQNGECIGSIGLAPQVDLVLTTSSEVCSWYGVEGSPAIFWPLASSAEIFSPKKDQKRDIDVLFIGNKYGSRGKIVQKIIDSGIDIHCYGHGWSNGFASFEQSAALFKRARIILGIGTVGHCRNFYTMKLRDFDAPMSGALYLTHRNKDLAHFYIEGQDIECYETPQEAIKKIKHYLSNPRDLEKVANSGRKKALTEHTWRYRLQTLFAKLGMT